MIAVSLTIYICLVGIIVYSCRPNREYRSFYDNSYYGV